MASTIGSAPRAESIPGVEGTSVADVAAPRAFYGKTLAALDVRNRHNVSVLLIKRKEGDEGNWVNTLPEAQYVFQPNDVMLVMGSDEKIRQFERLAR